MLYARRQSDHLLITSEKRPDIRADRLIQALLFLQGRPRLTAAELADELEVSVSTARRDLEALAMAGVPIYPTRGRGGGWRLIGGARTDLTGLTEVEVTSLLVGLTQTRATDPERVAAIRKLVRAMPEPFRAGAERIAAATVRDAPWGAADEEPDPPAVAELQHAIARERRVRIDYDGSRGEVDVVLVPLIVGSRGARWYLLAAPPATDAGVADVDRLRTYRVDRIRTVTTLDSHGIAPEDFARASEWERMVARVERMRGSVRAMLRVEPWAVRALLDRFGVQARLLDQQSGSDARTFVEVRAHRTDALAEQVAAWATVAEIVEPPEMREALRAHGQRIVDTYADPGEAS